MNSTLCFSTYTDPFNADNLGVLGLIFSSFLVLLLGLSLSNQPIYFKKIPANLCDPFYQGLIHGEGSTKLKHRLILVRHGESEHNKSYEVNSGNKVNVDSQLTAAGIEQASQIGYFFNDLELFANNIIVSPMKRAWDTAQPTIKFLRSKTKLGKVDISVCPKALEVNIWHDSEVGYVSNKIYISQKETYSMFKQRIAEWVKEIEVTTHELDKPTQTIIFTHSMVISEILNTIASRSFLADDKKENDSLNEDNWSNIYWRVSNGSITCVDLAEDDKGRQEWHVHAVNYTRHLNTITGAKCPFV